ncbi:MAG: ATP-binding protein [Myxococcota bacterium]
MDHHGESGDTEVRGGARDVVPFALWRSLPYALLALAGVYGGLAVFHGAHLGRNAYPAAAAGCGFVALAAVVAAISARTRREGEQHVRRWILAAGLVNALATGWLCWATGEPGWTPFLGVMAIASAYFFFERRDLAVILGSIGVAFAAGFWSPAAKPGWDLAALHLGVALVAAGVLRSARRVHLHEFGRLREERDRREQELRDSEARWRGFAENARDVIALLDEDDRTLYVNPRFSEIYPVETGNLMGRSPIPALAQGSRAAGRDALERWRAGSDEVHTFQVEIGGEKRWIEVAAAPVPIADGNTGILTFSRDITDRLALEERLRSAQKDEGLALMAAGVAHDFNNLLAVALVETELAQRESTNPDVDSRLQRVEDALLRSRTLTQQLLAYTGSAAAVREALDLSEHVEELYPLMQSSIPGGARLRFDLCRDLPAIQADPTQLHQALMNVVWNAAEASAVPGGRVLVRTGASFLSEADVVELQPAEERLPGLYAWVEVRDNGHGIPGESQPRIFDPFYSTHEPGRGLGLAAVIGIVRAHAGGIHVSSVEGQGSLFRIYLPAFERRGGKRAEAQPEGARLLLIHPDVARRSVLKQAVRGLGHRTLEADSLRVGIARLRNEAKPADLVLLGGAGRSPEALRREVADVRRVAPDLPILIAGEDARKRTDTGELEGLDRVAWLPSPLTPIGLANAIDALLWGDEP